MHDVDFADVVGKKPIVLLFATPALCQSRVCGPVVDVAEQVKRDRPDDAAFIHMEIYNDNDPNKGAPPAGRSPTTCAPSRGCSSIDSDGTVSTRIEGAFSVDELNAGARPRPVGPRAQSSPFERRILGHSKRPSAGLACA